MYRVVFIVAALVGLVTPPAKLQAQASDQVTQEIRAVVNATYDYTKENLRDQTGTYSSQGSLEFWSSGGLANMVPPDAPVRTYESFSLTPKYIWVISVAEGVAVAQYYVEGSYQETGMPPVDHYFTRATEVYVRENGEWKVRAAHWSPVAGGSGTQQTSIIG